MRAELAAIRKRGYSIDDEEQSPGIRCVGAPIRNLSGRVFASIGVSGPARRLTRAKNRATGRLVVHYADGVAWRCWQGGLKLTVGEGDSLCMTPPPTITDDEADWALEGLDAAPTAAG